MLQLKVEGVMELERQPSQREVEAVLAQDEDPIAKVQELVDMGIDEEMAAEIVERYQIGQQAVVYYEQLPYQRADNHYDL